MPSNLSGQPANRRYRLTGLLTAVFLSLAPGFAWAQGLPRCHPESQERTVASTSDTTNLASLLQCSNGSFSVKWYGEVVVSQTMYITQGTSLNITGASADATADGNHTIQMFAVDGASSLHLMDMVLANGDADYGGAVLALGQASVSFSGNMTFASNTATYGGAIYANQSTIVFWGDKQTLFLENNAVSGGAIMTEGSSYISWGGAMIFSNNSAHYNGGAISSTQSSEMSWTGKTSFLENTASFGGAVHAELSTVVWACDETAFSNNTALYGGGALAVISSPLVSWCGIVLFSNNSAGVWGGAISVHESSIEASTRNSIITGNAARYGGAMYAYSSSVVWTGGMTIFSKNSAFDDGGAVMAENSPSVSWEGETVFVNNKAAGLGGAIYVRNYSNVWFKGFTNFHGNVAHEGGAIMAQSTSAASWEGETIFSNNRVNLVGGGASFRQYSNVSWTGNTTFDNNYAHLGFGGAIFLYVYSVGVWSGTTTFARNTGWGGGGGAAVGVLSIVSWSGETTFETNIGDRGGAILVSYSNISWTGSTEFSGNIAPLDGGAIHASVNSHVVCRGTTTFSNNTATTGNGGAINLYGFQSEGGPIVNIYSGTTFSNNSAFAKGGAVYSAANPNGQYYEGVVFRYNSASVGGAVAMYGTGNYNEIGVSPTIFHGCWFISNAAIDRGGAVETAFGQEVFISTHFDSNTADVGGALNLGGATTIWNCSFTSNMVSRRGLAVAAIGSVEIQDSSFHGNAIFCEEGQFMQENLQYSTTARYDSVCLGCPSWNECRGCSIIDSNVKPICAIALKHTKAGERGTTLQTLSVDRGFWRATNESSTILACYNAGSCLGGQTGDESFCGDGYMGPYCSVCQSGYSSSVSTTCTRCSQPRRRGLVAVVAIAGVVSACAIAAFSAHLVSTNFEERDHASIYHILTRKAQLQALKSVIVVWQILTQFASVANITYPGVYQTFLRSLSFINLDIGLVLSIGCLWSGMDFHDRLIAATIWPLTTLVWLAMTYAVALRRNVTAGDAVREKIRNKHLSAVLFLLFLVYSSVSSTVFRMFACDFLDDDELYLRADYRILCTDAKHRALQGYAGFMIAVYPVGIPLLFSVLLYRHREVLSDFDADKAAAQSIDSLWAPYRPRCFYYEVVECARRIVLTGVVVFIYPNDTAQIAITIINSFFFLVVSEVLSPYKSVSDTWLSRFGHVLILFSMFDVLLLKVDASQESSESQRILAGVFVAGHVVLIVTVVAEAITLCFASRLTGDDKVEEPNPFQNALSVRSVKTSSP